MSEVRVIVGQQWRSKDRRDRERIVEVTSVEEHYVRLRNLKTGLVRKVLRNRMRPCASGFELVKDIDDAPPKSEPEAAA